jgi:acetyltransferase
VQAVSQHKPVVALVVGRTDVSAFAESHTGALATSWRTARALLAQAGAVVVDDERELVDALTVLSRTRLAADRARPGIALVTAQAGPGLLVLDQLQAHGIALPTLAPTTQAALANYLPSLTFQQNPVDTGRPGTTFADVLATTAADPTIDALAVYALAEPDAIDLATAVHRSSVQDKVPVVIGIGGDADATRKTAASAEAIGVPVLTSPTALANGMRALALDARPRHVTRSPHHTRRPIRLPTITLPADEAAAKDVLDAIAIATPPRRICADRAAAHRALSELRPPVAVKILDAAIQHKTDVGGVHLGVASPAELDTALEALAAIGAPAYLLESMVAPGVDLIVGARRDPTFGPIILAGLGGVTAEAAGDVVIRSHTVTSADAADMLDELQCAPLLNGWRGGPVLDRAEFARIVVTLGRLLVADPRIGDIEINPLRCTADGLVALDATITAAPRLADPGERTPR